jgi:ankyrin repeat protein
MPRLERALPPTALASGVALAAVAGLGGAPAAIAATLAQPAFALAVARRRGVPAATAWPRHALGLVGLWVASAVLFAALVAWPFSSLLEGGSLGAALAASLAFGIALIAAWRVWPLWQGMARSGGHASDHWRELARVDTGDWRGLGAALAVVLLAALPLLLAWPGLLGSGLRWGIALASIVVAPLLHGLLQRIPPPQPLAGGWPALVGEDGDEADDVEGDALAPGETPETALYAAARNGRVDRALALLEAGADAAATPPSDSRDQRSLPVLSAVLPDLRLLRALIGRGVDLNAMYAGMTPLLAATRDSWHGRPEAVMTLLANGADPRVRDLEGNTPLHHAARSSDPGVAALLRDAAAELEVRNNDGLTPLGVACAAGNWRLARFLLERGAVVQADGATPALLAAAGAEDDDAAGVQLLLKHKARVDARDLQGRSALHEAAFRGHAEIIAALLAAHADVHARDGRGRTPLLAAARGGSAVAADVLAAAGADVHAVDVDGHGALVLACVASTPSPELVRRLLALGADPSLVDREGRRALDHAVQAGRWSLVAVLDPSHPLPAALADDDAAPGTEQASGAVADDDVAQVEAPPAPDVEAREGLADSRLFALLAQGSGGIVELAPLLDAARSPAGAGGLALFLEACAAEGHDGAREACESFALALCERGADPFGTSRAGNPPLALAVRLGWLRLCERLLDAGADTAARDAHGMTPLHLAAALGREPALKLLVRHGAAPDARAPDGQTPLGVALSSGRRDLVDWLEWHGWPLPQRKLQPADLPAAAIVGDSGAVRRLLDLGFPIDAADAQGCTALLRAAGGGHRECVELLLDRGADPRLAAQTGATPLSAAVSMRHAAIVDRLLGAGAGLEQRLPGEVTVLMLAAALGLPDLVARLLQAGADVHACDAQGLTPLHCAVLFAFTAREKPRVLALLDTLLLAGAEPDARAGPVTPLLLLLGSRAEPGTACDEDVVHAAIERLLDEDVALDVQDQRGFGPLHLAALHGLLRVTQRLLRAGCDPGLRDGLNRTPREVAVMRGFVDVAGEYAPAQPGGASLARFLRPPPTP